MTAPGSAGAFKFEAAFFAIGPAELGAPRPWVELDGGSGFDVRGRALWTRGRELVPSHRRRFSAIIDPLLLETSGRNITFFDVGAYRTDLFAIWLESRWIFLY
jgi:hypothetical protein